jgi:hypothetical protein
VPAGSPLREHLVQSGEVRVVGRRYVGERTRSKDPGHFGEHRAGVVDVFEHLGARHCADTAGRQGKVRPVGDHDAT